MRHAAPLVPLTADDLTWTIAGTPSPWPSPQPAIDLALAALLEITDPIAIGIVLALLTTVADLHEHVAAQRQLTAAGLSEWERKARADVRRRRIAEAAREARRRGSSC